MVIEKRPRKADQPTVLKNNDFTAMADERAGHSKHSETVPSSLLKLS